jgi:hypothetical protein
MLGVVTSYTRWLKCVQVKEDTELEVKRSFPPAPRADLDLSQESVFRSTWNRNRPMPREDGAKKISLG